MVTVTPNSPLLSTIGNRKDGIHHGEHREDQAVIEYAKTLDNVPWCEDYEKMVSGML